MALNFPTWNMGYLTYPDVQEYLKQKDIVIASRRLASSSTRIAVPGSPTAFIARPSPKSWRSMPRSYCTPQMGVGYPPHHMGPPNLGLWAPSPCGLRDLAQHWTYDICRSLIHHGFNKLILVVGHASNTTCIDPSTREP